MPRSTHSASMADGADKPATASTKQGTLPLGNASTPIPTTKLSTEELRSVIESTLFVAGRPVQIIELRRLLGLDETKLRKALDALAQDCERSGRGIRLQQTADQVQFVSAPENAHFVAAFLGLPTQARLTTAALETLAVVAYRQPVTRSQIEFIRGVNSDRSLASLIQYGLVQEVGRAATIGRPALFGTTPEFLQQFGLTSLDALPQPGHPGLEALEQRRSAEAQHIREAMGSENDARASDTTEQR